eukprot:6492725-Amphidinium_carterae.1
MGDGIGLGSTHYEFVSPAQHNPNGTGGVVLVVEKSFYDRFRCSVRSLFDGRAVALDMYQDDSATLCATVAGVHVTESAHHSWSEVARAVATQVDMSKRIFIIGDLNFVDESLDSISFEGNPIGRIGQRAREWSRLFPRFTQMIAGLTHWNTASRCMSALDRLYTNMDTSEVLACNLTLKMTGGCHSSEQSHCNTPALSDHHSIEMSWQKNSDTPHLAQWIFADSLWASTSQSVAAQLWDEGLMWQDQIALLERIIHEAAAEVRQARKLVCRDNHRQVLAHCLRTLRHLEFGEEDDVRQLCCLAPFLHLGPASDLAQVRKVLCRTANQAHAKHLEELSREKKLHHHTDSSTSSRSHWYGRMWRAWKLMKLLPVADVLDASGKLCENREEEIEAFTAHWKPVFQNFHELPRDLDWLLAYVPRADWVFDVSETDLLNVIAHAPNSAVGPDCVPYRAYRSIANVTAKVLGSVIEALHDKISLPTSWKELVTVFIPKKPLGPLRASEFRPLALLNTLGKLLARAVSEKLSFKLHAVLHPKQCGFLPHRGAGDALIALETSCFELAVEHAESVVLGLDFAAAFPSLSRRWLHSVLIASGCAGWVLHFLEEICTAFYSAIDWRHQRSAWIQVTSGLLQGHPVSALLYVLATDAWTRWVQQQLTVPGTISSFADDAQTTHALQYAKCRLMPIGAHRNEFAAALAAICDDDHPFRRMQIVDSMRVLGWWLGVGADHELDVCALQRMQQCIPRLFESGLGMIGNQFLLERGIFTSAAHVLRSSQASSALRTFVDSHQELLASQPRAWFRPFSQHAHSMFGLPVKYHSADALQLLLQIKGVHGHGNDVCAGYERAVSQFENSGLEEHPLAGWLKKGALATRHLAFNAAVRHGWVKLNRFGDAEWQDWTRIRAHIKRLHSTHEVMAKDALIERLNYTCSSLPVAFLRSLKRGALVEAVRKISRHSPAGAISLLRVFLNGLPDSRHLHHPGDCCLCGGMHGITLGPTWILNGCFKPLLENEPNWRWLQRYTFDV